MITLLGLHCLLRRTSVIIRLFMITKAKTSYKSWPGYIVQNLFARTIPNSKGRLSRVCRLNLLSVHLRCTSARSGHGMRSSHRIKLKRISCPRSGWASFAHTQSYKACVFCFQYGHLSFEHAQSFYAHVFRFQRKTYASWDCACAKDRYPPS